MDELEHRLRSALTEMAEGVPPSHHAWVDQERRLALKSRRARIRPALMAAVAAAVVALIAVPVMIVNVRSNEVRQADIPTTSTSTEQSRTASPSSLPSQPSTAFQTWPNPYTAVPGERLLLQPFSVGSVSFGQDTSGSILTYAVYRESSQTNELCLVKLPNEVPINGSDSGKYPAPRCTVLKAPPNPTKTVWYQVPISDASQPGNYVYVVSKNVASIMVRRTEGDLKVGYSSTTTSPDFNVVLVQLLSTKPPTAYTTRDQANNTLENG
jgi:hypothetical protein